ncbi:MAG: AI-2E family transporter [Candidatus Symbiothrix sp.]|jgi:predicted PurR-regulated permease PerM|nr:AI-2E family transporter [Candidatus Symbiothrix sp.]
MDAKFDKHLRQIFFLLAIIFLACLIIGELAYFASSVLSAITVYAVLRKPHRHLVQKGWSKGLVSSLLLIATIVFFALVLGGLSILIYSKATSFDVQSLKVELHHLGDWIFNKWGYNIFSQDVVEKGLEQIGKIVPSIVSTTGSALTNLVMMLFVLYFMFQGADEMEHGLNEYLPFDPDTNRELKAEGNNMILANAVGVPLIMFGQMVTSGIGFWVFQAGDPVIWGIISGFVGLIPIGGTLLVWAPLGINLMLGGHIWEGTALLVYGLLVISNVDRLVQMTFLKKKAHVHALVTIFGVILGMKIFGFWGVIFGPLLLATFFFLVKVYKREYGRK